MNTFDLTAALGLGGAAATSGQPGHFGIIFLRLACAAALGSLIAYRVWRKVIPTALPPARETAQAQVLIAVAGALIISVIGDSTARAFGLVGLGGFIRFRSGIKDPREAAVMFIMIGIGMASGHGSLPLALVTTVFAGVILALFDAGRRARLRMTRLAISLEDPRQALEPLRLAFPAARFLEAPNGHPEPGRVLMEVPLQEATDAAAILEMLRSHAIPGVKTVLLDESKAVA
jgi:hypothetical protein